ncbi:hypothetical protein J831_2204 [Acinetobacter baumannii 25691_8]|nr:hypothetical protein J831_2204 [Acinetobacter baumannii 25691_8]
MSYVHVDNSPFAIFTWKVLGIFKMEGKLEIGAGGLGK